MRPRTPGARSEAQVRPGLRLRQTLGRRLSVPPRGALQRRQRRADVADRGQAVTQAPITARLGEILVVAQVYDPKLLIAEFTAPATISGVGDQPRR